MGQFPMGFGFMPSQNQTQMNKMYNMFCMAMMMDMFQKMQQQWMMRNQNFNNFGVYGGNSNDSIKTILPKNREMNFNPFMYVNSPKINLIFISTSNLKVNMVVPINLKLKDLFKTFIEKVGLKENVLGSYINFVFNGTLIKVNDERTIWEAGMTTDYINVMVIDTSNLLGGK